MLPERIGGPNGLLIRRWAVEDAEPLDRAIAESAEHLRPWMGWIALEPVSLAQRRSRIEEWGRQWAEGNDATLGVFLDGRVVGGCGLHRRVAPDGLEIGYWIHPDFTRRGLATEVASLLTDAPLALPDVTHVEIHHDKANLASGGVPRKLGFEFLGEQPEKPLAPSDLGIEWRWRMDQARWEARRSGSG